MIRVFRQTIKAYAQSAAQALSGEGGLFADGRWHSRRRVVYAADSRALSLLERLVHLNLAPAEDTAARVLIEIVIPDTLPLRRLPLADLETLEPAWRSPVARPATRELGNTWLDGRSSVGLWVPSAVVPGDWCLLLNPAHPQMAEIVAANDPLTLHDVPLDPRIAMVYDRAFAAKAAR